MCSVEEIRLPMLCVDCTVLRRQLRRLAASLGDEQPILVADDEPVDYSRTISLDRHYGRRSTKKNKNASSEHQHTPSHTPTHYPSLWTCPAVGLRQFPSVPKESFQEHVQELIQTKGFAAEYKVRTGSLLKMSALANPSPPLPSPPLLQMLEDTSPNHPITAAFKRENVSKNRYRNISPCRYKVSCDIHVTPM